MDDKADAIQRCIDEKLKHQIESEAARTWDYEAQSTGNFSRWVKILEVGTFNLIERLVIKAALYSHKRMATKKIICSTLIDGGYTSKEEEDYRDYPDPEMDKYHGELQGHLKGYPGYENAPIHPQYGDVTELDDLKEILTKFSNGFRRRKPCK